MIFNSLIYIFFLPIIVIAYYISPMKVRWVCLLIASIGYYLSFIPIFLVLLIIIAIANYFLANRMANIPENRNSRLLILIVFMNILILAFFKYFTTLFPDNQLSLYTVNFFFRVNPINKMVLPLGLSYITFTVISYQIEIKRKTIQPEKHFGFFSLYLLFFPKIAQGPIEKPQQLIPQLSQGHYFNYDMIVEGLKIDSLGIF